MELKGSRTEKNLLAAFTWESQERNRLSIFANTAEKEGYHRISRLFSDFAEHERIHAKNFFRFLPEGESEIPLKYSAGKNNTTEENLKSTIDGKVNTSIKKYGEWANIARNEGFEEIARLFLNIMVAEQTHERILRLAYKVVQEGMMWSREEPVEWICMKCGFTMEGNEPPGKCPACGHPREYFEIFTEKC
jgi:rubrerythrin